MIYYIGYALTQCNPRLPMLQYVRIWFVLGIFLHCIFGVSRLHSGARKMFCNDLRDFQHGRPLKVSYMIFLISRQVLLLLSQDVKRTTAVIGMQHLAAFRAVGTHVNQFIVTGFVDKVCDHMGFRWIEFDAVDIPEFDH